MIKRLEGLCPTCHREMDRAARLQQEAACLGTHRVREAFLWLELGYGIAHLWLDEQVYAATVKRDEPITDDEALAWLDRAHRREVPIRPWIEGVMTEVDPWEDSGR